jgi:hypothetical protein
MAELVDAPDSKSGGGDTVSVRLRLSVKIGIFEYMESRDKILSFNTPHNHSNSVLIRYLEGLMRLTYHHPELMKYIVYVMGASSIVLLPSYFLLPAALSVPMPIAGIASTAGLGGLLLSSFNAFAQHRIVGFPIPLESKSVYQNKKYEYRDAKANLIVNDVDMPMLTISAKNHFNAGYAEGYILGDYIRRCLHKLNELMKILLYFVDVPDRILETIPQRFQDEMRGKVTGYNQWLRDQHINENVSFKDYLIIQLLPDLTTNYLPIANKLQFLLKPLNFLGLGCTTVAIRLKNYTAYLRLLDWPSQDLAGKYILQISRNILGSKKTIDLSLPVLSGALTVLNENGLLVQMNVSSGNKGNKIKGMPALFFNREIAETSASVEDAESLLKEKKPLAAYHLTTTDGKNTKSFHFYQNKSDTNKHDIETLSFNKKKPQLLVIANAGIKSEDKIITITNHRDSAERSHNIHQFFYKNIRKFKRFIKKQTGSKELDGNDIHSLIKLILEIARLNLVNNLGTVLCALYIYRENAQQRLIHASAIADNLYAASAELTEFKQLRRP